MNRTEYAVLIADISEYVRIVEIDEENAIRRWQSILGTVGDEFSNQRKGRIVKNTGDGILAVFDDARNAVMASKFLHGIAERESSDYAHDQKFRLRIGIDFGDVIQLSDDIMGNAVNRAARLMSLANPGETVVSSSVRDGLSEHVDAAIDDLGNCYLRHLSHPVRAFRITDEIATSSMPLVGNRVKLQPVLAVIPFQPLIEPERTDRTGDVISEEIIRLMSRSDEIAVISRLSTAALSARALTIDEIAGHLGADYILSGFYRIDHDDIVIDAELAESKSATIIWAERFNVKRASILSPVDSPCSHISSSLFSAIMLHELSLSRKQPLPTLESYTLLLSAVELMHHLSPTHYHRSRSFLEELIHRGGRHAVPHAWLANWHVLRVIQGWSKDIERDTNLALRNCGTALDSDPECELALTMDGFVNLHLRRRFDAAEARFDDALLNNPSFAIARLLKGTMYAFSDRGDLAVEETEKALALSPLDPHRFIFETHCAGAHLSAGNFERAIELAQSARRSNRRHASTLRILTTGLWETGREQEAKAVAKELLNLEPDLTKESYLKRSPNADFAIGKRIASVLNMAGIPA